MASIDMTLGKYTGLANEGCYQKLPERSKRQLVMNFMLLQEDYENTAHGV